MEGTDGTSGKRVRKRLHFEEKALSRFIQGKVCASV